MGTQKSLKNDFSARNRWFSNRASAIFPARQRTGCDIKIVFLNYWSLKNRVEDVVFNVRLYDEVGLLLFRESKSIESMHTEISIRDIYEENFDGMIEIEMLSQQNIRFTFPAVVCFYEANSHFSVVHSAGRIRNSDEPFRQKKTIETNWTCKFTENISPFCHIFNGPSKPNDSIRIEATLYEKDMEPVVHEIDTGITTSFGSKIIVLDEYFSPKSTTDGCFIQVRVAEDAVFPRLVVGNLHKDIDFLEATHSFPKVEIPDFVENDSHQLRSFMPLIQSNNLDVDFISFPTNTPAKVIGKIRSTSDQELPLAETGETIEWETGGSVEPFIFCPRGKGQQLTSIDFEGVVPARLNCNYRFSVKGANSTFSTDIATGAKSCDYPPKHSHWGHGLVSSTFRTTLLLRNMSHNPTDTQENDCRLTIFLKDGSERTHTFRVEKECFKILDLNDLIQSSKEEIETLSWFLAAEGPGIETFWVSYAPDGRILGEHGF